MTLIGGSNTANQGVIQSSSVGYDGGTVSHIPVIPGGSGDVNDFLAQIGVAIGQAKARIQVLESNTVTSADIIAVNTRIDDLDTADIDHDPQRVYASTSPTSGFGSSQDVLSALDAAIAGIDNRLNSLGNGSLQSIVTDHVNQSLPPVVPGTVLNDDCIASRHIPNGSIGSSKLGNSGVTAGQYSMPQLTLNAQGQVTLATSMINFGTLSGDDLLKWNSTSGQFDSQPIKDLLPQGTANGVLTWDGTNHQVSGSIIISSGNVGVGGVTSPLETLHLAGAMILGNTGNSNAGAIRYSGGFEGNDGTGWKSFTKMNNGEVLPDHLDETAAKLAGLVQGDFFRTGEVVKQVVTP